MSNGENRGQARGGYPCGSTLLFEHAALPEAVFVAVANLDDEPSLRANAHIFVGSKASWFDITDDLPQHEEYPPHAGS